MKSLAVDVFARVVNQHNDHHQTAQEIYGINAAIIFFNCLRHKFLKYTRRRAQFKSQFLTKITVRFDAAKFKRNTALKNHRSPLQIGL